jgi:chitin disaccharide deacetylase
LGLPLLDQMFGLDLRSADDPVGMTKQAFAGLQPGITHFILHPSIDSPELRAITPDWRARVADYETFMREDLRRFIQDQGIHLIGYRALQTLMPDPASLPDLPF